MEQLTKEQRKLAEDNINLVHLVLHRYIKPSPNEYDDCFSEGQLGLCKAAQYFKPELGYAFSTYAVSMIMGEIKRFRRDNKPIKYSRRYRDIKAKIAEYMRINGDDCDVYGMLKDLNISAIDYQVVIAVSNIFSLDEHVSGIKEEDNERTIADMIPDERAFYDFECQISEELLIALENEVVKNEPERTRAIYDEWFYETIMGEPVTQVELGKKYGVSQATVARTIKRLNAKLVKKYQES